MRSRSSSGGRAGGRFATARTRATTPAAISPRTSSQPRPPNGPIISIIADTSSIESSLAPHGRALAGPDGPAGRVGRLCRAGSLRPDRGVWNEEVRDGEGTEWTRRRRRGRVAGEPRRGGPRGGRGDGPGGAAGGGARLRRAAWLRHERGA